MALGDYTLLEWFVLFERELLLFSSIAFLVGAADEFGSDLVYFWLRLTGRGRTPRIDRQTLMARPLAGRAAVFIPAWKEAAVIGATVSHALGKWGQADLRLYVGCYANDPATISAVIDAARGDPRLRVVLNDRDGPSTKADCLNRLYRAMEEDERRGGIRTRMVLLHDAEDMVDPAGLALLDRAMDDVDFAQLPVVAIPQPDSRWISGHYCDEFAEAHAKSLVVRDALGAGLPAAGVGCAFSREMLALLERENRGHGGPFSVESLTEDYELGLRIKAMGGRSRFLRVRDEQGQLIATRACFPPTLETAVRQKTRWIHGIALQGWDRLGWHWEPVELWMRLHDRRGPMAALVLALGYALLVLSGGLWGARLAGLVRPWEFDIFLDLMLIANFAAFGWRALLRYCFTAREYGWREGLRAIARIPVANVIAIMAGRRAFVAYLGTLGGALPHWDKTEHAAHPVLMQQAEAGA